MLSRFLEQLLRGNFDFVPCGCLGHQFQRSRNRRVNLNLQRQTIFSVCIGEAFSPPFRKVGIIGLPNFLTDFQLGKIDALMLKTKLHHPGIYHATGPFSFLIDLINPPALFLMSLAFRFKQNSITRGDRTSQLHE